MPNKPAITFTAKDYGDEYMRLKRDFPDEANRIASCLSSDYENEYIKKIRSEEPKDWKDMGIKHPGIFKGLLFGFLTSSIASTLSLAVTVVTAGASAPITLPMAAGGFLTAYGAVKIGAKLHDAESLAKKSIRQDIESGELIKRKIEALKRMDRPVPSYLENFDYDFMAKHHAPVIEAKPVVSLPMLNHIFDAHTAKKELPAPAHPPKNNLQPPPP